MAYKKTQWQDHVVEYPNKYEEVSNPDGTVTLIPKQGEVIQQGTPMSATNFNKMEEGIFQAHVSVENITGRLNEVDKIVDNSVSSLTVNFIAMAVEVETLKGATLNDVTANMFVETFLNLDDINLQNGKYDEQNKRIYA
ncbi:hypothetical protein SAMN02744040_00118 [Tepidibacter thalassicus DSM 15285]|uniref:Uncharacterized protein n=1 Tax=Tepidibacter thalassicus DSM 15285 TaxID=1123350 RepID=A0A1M5NMK7_9FIRM|nr:hypothetical protein SAMN02744040_00118 [Tepidibacter thalassicus DSM 15285]